MGGLFFGFSINYLTISYGTLLYSYKYRHTTKCQAEYNAWVSTLQPSSPSASSLEQPYCQLTKSLVSEDYP